MIVLELYKIDVFLKNIYTQFNKPEAWKLIRYDVGHMETSAMRRDAISFFEKWL